MSGTDHWLVSIRAAEQLGQETMQLINERNQSQRLGSGSSRVASNIRVNLQKFSDMIKDLENDLMRSSSSHMITPREAERRQYQIDQLKSKEKQLNQAFKPKEYGSQSMDRSGLLNVGFGSSDYDPFSSARGGAASAEINTDEIRNKQKQLLKEQDKGLDALVGVIQRQKLMGQNIGEEVDYHNDLIDEIHDHVDTTERRLVQENKHVKKVTKKAGSCGLIVIVILLLVAIIVVAVVPT
ncbi:syntaxin-8-like isoform X2 [Rhopilema esculentum]|uniref:syntaxin-8-like isoform X2 n=1 Tax=Rhopilema esculentum TaxID=499914 RepID=UPI0031D74121